MHTTNLSPSQLKKRKMLLVLPLLVIPFMTLAFYALGGGSSRQRPDVANPGLNLTLPGPNSKDDKMVDKLSFYDKAARDSSQLAEWMRSDPYFQQNKVVSDTTRGDLRHITQTTAQRYNQRLIVSPYDGSGGAEDAVLKKLALLQSQLDNNFTTSAQEANLPLRTENGHIARPEVSRLENLLNRMHQDNSEDPEMKQLSAVMDKILDIQHPDRVKERMKEYNAIQDRPVSFVSARARPDTGEPGFYGLEPVSTPRSSNAISAVVHEDQQLVNGAVIKFRLLQDVFIDDKKIPAGNFVFGVVSLSGERLNVPVQAIRCGDYLFTVDMEVHDMDGLPGIYIPGAITRDVAKQAADNSLQMMELTSLDPSLKAQATAAGINTAKSLLSRKVKLVKVMVKAGYKVLLKDKSIRQ
jgi:conjugative transposon TraM protein